MKKIMFFILGLLALLTLWYVSNNPNYFSEQQIERIKIEEGL